MNVRVAFAALALYISAGVVHADDHCSTASLDGRYAGSQHSQFTNPQLNLGDASASVGLTYYDGHGNFTVTSGVLNANGTIFHFTASGTYEVKADCSYTGTGSVVLQLPGGPFTVPNLVTVGVVADQGRRIESMSGSVQGPGALTQTSGLATGSSEKLETLPCSKPPPAQYVAHGLILGQPNGAGGYVAGTLVATFFSNAAGDVTGNSINNFGSFVHTGTINDASLVVNPDCTATFGGTGPGSSHFWGVAVMKPGSVTLHMVEVDPPPVDPATGGNLPGTTLEFTAFGTPQYE